MNTAPLLEELANTHGFASGHSACEANAIFALEEHYCVIPDRYPLTSEHYLLVSRAFETNLVKNATNSRARELVSILDAVMGLRESPAHSLLYFEHGTADDKMRAVCGTIHAHVHLLFLPQVQCLEILRRANEAAQSNSYLPCDIPTAASDMEYITFGTFMPSLPKLGQHSYKARRIESQFMRRIVGEVVNAEWDWKALHRSAKGAKPLIPKQFMRGIYAVRQLTPSLQVRKRAFAA